MAPGRGHRGIVQTSQPGHLALAMLRAGHPIDFLQDLGRERERSQLPPAAELVSIEVDGDVAMVERDVAALSASELQIHGPERGGGRSRWFIQGRSLQQMKVRLRPLVQRWRDAGSKVRIDADPIDL